MNSEKPKTTINQKLIFRWVPGFLLSFIALIALVKFVPIDQAFILLRRVSIYYYLLAALFILLFLLVRAIGWRALLGFRPTYKDTFLNLSLGYFINNIFPFRLGEISRALFMGATIKVNPGLVLSSIFLERVFDLFILAFFLLLMLPHVIGVAWMKTIAWTILGIMIIGFIFIFFITQNSVFVEKALTKIGKRSRLTKKIIIPFILSIMDGFKSIKEPKQLVIGFVGIIGSWLVSFFQFSLFLYMMTGTSEWWWGAFANTALALGIALPSAPAGLGLYESSIVAGLKIFNIDESIALAFALIMHVSQFVLVGILGMFTLYKDGNSLKSLYSQLLNLKNTIKTNPISGEGNG